MADREREAFAETELESFALKAWSDGYFDKDNATVKDPISMARMNSPTILLIRTLFAPEASPAK
jgi:hypothetical protein